MINNVKSHILKAILVIYIVAFTSLYTQVQTLFGDNGVAPLKDFVANQKTVSNNQKGYLDPYNIVLLAPKLGLNYATQIELLCLLSVSLAISALFTKRLVNAVTFGLLWYVYYSIACVGQGFVDFHSDLLLLEVGFISILLAPLLPSKGISQADHDHLSLFLLRWLVVRYFLSNVFNIYLEKDESWYKMTAIPMLAHGINFPSLFSWQIYNLPPEYLKLLQAYYHTTVLVTPFLSFIDLKLCRLMTFWTLFITSLSSALVANFGWTDLLIMISLMAFQKDQYLSRTKKSRRSWFIKTLDVLILSIYVAVVAFIMVNCFGIKLINGHLFAQIMFDQAKFKLLVDHLVPVAFVVGILGLLHSTYVSFFRPSRRTSIFKTILYSIIAGLVFFSTFPTLSRFAPGLETKIKTLQHTKDLSRAIAPLRISNNYLLIPRLSEHYADSRPELQIQGRNSDSSLSWYQYDFKYKCNSDHQDLVRIIPHIPRIELRMWYAARSKLEDNQWLLTLAYRIATNQPAVVKSLLSQSASSSKQVRIAIVRFKYSEKREGPVTKYFKESKYVEDYLKPTYVDNLKNTIKSNGISLIEKPKILSGDKVKSIDDILNKYLDIFGDIIRDFSATIVVWTSLAISLPGLIRRR